MVDHPWLALGPRRLAVHAGTGGTAGREACGEVGVAFPGRCAARSDAQQNRDPTSRMVPMGPGSAAQRTAAPRPGHENVTPRSGIEAGQPEMILYGSRSGVAA